MKLKNVRLLEVAQVELSAIHVSVARQFESIPEVQSIYFQLDGDVLVYPVFSNENTYDQELSHRLIACEAEIMDAHPEIQFDFYYMNLAMCPDPRAYVGANAVAIYHRNEQSDGTRG